MILIKNLPFTINPYSFWNTGYEHDDRDAGLQKQYIIERNRLLNNLAEENFTAFLRRWHALWRRYEEKMPQTEEETWLADAKAELRQVSPCLMKLCNKDRCQHTGIPGSSCCAMHIMIPLPLLDASFVAAQYQVMFDLALFQINGGYPSLAYDWKVPSRQK